MRPLSVGHVRRSAYLIIDGTVVKKCGGVILQHSARRSDRYLFRLPCNWIHDSTLKFPLLDESLNATIQVRFKLQCVRQLLHEIMRILDYAISH